jgi:hypothetical protein
MVKKIGKILAVVLAIAFSVSVYYVNSKALYLRGQFK